MISDIIYLRIKNFLKNKLVIYLYFYCINNIYSFRILRLLYNIGSYAFYECTGFSGTLTLPEVLTHIGTHAFYHCIGFTGEIVIPNSVILIETSAFAQCMGINAVTIGVSVVLMWSNLFENTPLEYIRIESEIPPSLNPDTFNTIDKGLPVYIPCQTMQWYLDEPYWDEFTNYIEDCSLAVEGSEADEVLLYPNPTTGRVTVTCKDLKQAEVFNTLGQRVATATGEGEQLTVDISNLPAGVYFVNVTDGEGRKCVKKVVKE